MPTYEYECTECGKVFELFQPITEPPRRKLRRDDPRPCKCNARVARRIGTGGGLIFKGSGFYATDYRSESYKKGAKSETDGSKPSAEGGSKTEKKAETPKPTKKPSGD
jgi:putative FmdB family regulatory protein